MILSALLQQSAEKLRKAGVEIPERTAEWLWLHVSHRTKMQLLLGLGEPVDVAQQAEFLMAVERRARREPLQYIIGEAEFCGLLFHVDRRVLIPRPETALLVECAETIIREQVRLRGEEGVTVVDVGTGSGAIAVTLAKRLSGLPVRMLATDISSDALAVARINATRHEVDAAIEWHLGSLLDAVPADRTLHIVLSNPPYIATEDLVALQPEVVRYEPHLALFAPRAGLALYEALLAQTRQRLSDGGAWIVEMGIHQADIIAERVRTTWAHSEIEMVHDAQGIARILVAKGLRTC